ncbi:MAG: hypothetical protein IPG06_07130 [Haliea sp.]|nr:hypothetical protein [Haliea sp.]
MRPFLAIGDDRVRQRFGTARTIIIRPGQRATIQTVVEAVIVIICIVGIQDAIAIGINAEILKQGHEVASPE